MLTSRSRFTAKAFLLSTATGLMFSAPSLLFSQGAAPANAPRSEILEQLEEQYQREGGEVPGVFTQEVQKSQIQQLNYTTPSQGTTKRKSDIQLTAAEKPNVFQRMFTRGKKAPAKPASQAKPVAKAAQPAQPAQPAQQAQPQAPAEPQIQAQPQYQQPALVAPQIQQPQYQQPLIQPQIQPQYQAQPQYQQPQPTYQQPQIQIQAQPQFQQQVPQYQLQPQVVQPQIVQPQIQIQPQPQYVAPQYQQPVQQPIVIQPQIQPQYQQPLPQIQQPLVIQQPIVARQQPLANDADLDEDEPPRKMKKRERQRYQQQQQLRQQQRLQQQQLQQQQQQQQQFAEQQRTLEMQRLQMLQQQQQIQIQQQQGIPQGVPQQQTQQQYQQPQAAPQQRPVAQQSPAQNDGPKIDLSQPVPLLSDNDDADTQPKQTANSAVPTLTPTPNTPAVAAPATPVPVLTAVPAPAPATVAPAASVAPAATRPAPVAPERPRPVIDRNKPFDPTAELDEEGNTAKPSLAKKSDEQEKTANSSTSATEADSDSPFSGLKLAPDEAEQRVSRALGGPSDDSGTEQPALGNPQGELSKAPPTPDTPEGGTGTSRSSAGDRNSKSIPGLKGYCTVTLRKERQYVPGLSEFHVEYQSRNYTFASESAKEEFEKHPDKFAPVQNGNDVIASSSSQGDVPGTVDHAVTFRGRLYLFSTAENKAAFKASPKKYAQ